ncbi:M81 family metallopeptidase [Undibacterium sp.]|jgi:microcystin degradation protein MlrC|uniref:M81 family metallopeptidase n=1 Tax=Undibacterium sp. TaxID=1914977 RepID=UPI002C31DE90|nr:M81 family metallopeptidase [Undibacterium sp.]HTD05591.1 M81 family metallopeptidase [Undibacterium sp.]
MKIFTSCIATETNTFAPLPTSWASFEEGGLTYGAVGEDTLFIRPVIDLWRRRAAADGHALHEGFFAFAQPSGKTTDASYQRLKQDLLDSLRAVGPVDIVLLILHGAMVAQSCDDCEGDILLAVRSIVGPSAIIGVELDPHCHLTAAMVSTADIAILFKEYPHTDGVPRADELYTLCVQAARGEIRPMSALVDCRMVGFYPTTAEPMAGLVRQAKQLECLPGLLSVSIAHGFPWADVAAMGTRVLALADGDVQLACSTAEILADAIYQQRLSLLPKVLGIDEMLQLPHVPDEPWIVADAADNPGGGAPCDNTNLLRALLMRGATNTAVGCLWDPVAAASCASAGLGACLRVRLGGKMGVSSGDPLDLDVVIRGVAENYSQSFDGQEDALGLSVWLECAGIDIVVISKRTQTLSPSAFERLGVSLKNKSRIIVKSSHHFHAEFSRFSSRIVMVDAGGALSMNFAALPYEKRDALFFPKVADPYAEGQQKQIIFSSAELRSESVA